LDDSLDILFLGSLFPKGKEGEILYNSTSGVQNASNVLQHGIVSGLDSNCPGQVRIVNSLLIGSFPKHYKKPCVKTYRFSQTTNGNDINAGFLNIKGIKHFSRYWSLVPHIKKWALEKNGKKKALIAYSASATFTKLLLHAKRLNPEVITCLIVADLPQYMSSSRGRSIVFKLFVEVENKRIFEDIKHIDRFVLLTEQMRDAMQIKVPYAVVEGIAADAFDGMTDTLVNDGNKTILYTGSLTEKYGIMDLIRAFEKLPGENYRLVICGEGETKELVEQACERDDRIIFKGLLKREDVLKLQKSATVLINPRQNNENFTKYSFPSKTMEYMASATPVIMYKLDGVPGEYDEYLYYVEDGSADSLKNKISEVLSKPPEELRDFGMRAREWVMREKNSEVQAKKIIDMIERKQSLKQC